MFKKIGFFHFGINHHNPIGSLRAEVSAINNEEDIRNSLIVLPEGFNVGKFYKDAGACDYNPTCLSQLAEISAQFNMVFIVGLIINHANLFRKPYSSGYLIDGSYTKLICHKAGDDGTQNYVPCPSNCDVHNPIRYKKACIAILICMDVEDHPRCQALMNRVDSTDSDLKIVCITSCMHAGYFSGGQFGSNLISEEWKNKNIILANANAKDYSGCNSFLTNRSGEIIASFPSTRRKDHNKIVLRSVESVV